MAKKFDIVVIGSGPGGYVAALRASQLGFKTACIEKRKSFGGVCLNVGCIPSKALLESTEHYAFLKGEAKNHGIKAKDISCDFEEMMKRKENVVKELTKSVSKLFKKNDVMTYQGVAQFTSPKRILVEGEKIEAENFIIATGSYPTQLPFLKFDEKRVLSSTGALSLKKIPKKMLVIGAGVIGVELASVYNRLGSEIVVIEMLERICEAMDQTVSRALLHVLKKQNMAFHLEAKVESAKVSKKDVSLTVQTKEGKKEFEGDVCLIAVGRRPYTAELACETASVEKNKQGFILVNGNYQTSQPHIFAIGDVTEGPMLAHRASEEGVAVVDYLANKSSSVNYTAIPNVIYTHPEVAACGLTEEIANEKGLNIFSGSSPFRANPRALCSGDTGGLVKIIGEKNSGKLIGMHIIGPNASEMIATAVIGITKGVTVKEIGSVSFAHPTLSEAIKEASLQALGEAIHQ